MEENDKSYYKTMYYTLLSRHQKKNDKYKALKKDFVEVSAKLNRLQEEYIKNDSNLLKAKVIQLEKSNMAYKDILDTFIKQNKRLFNIHSSNVEEIAESTKNCLINLRTVLLDMEYAFTYQKLLEMHVCDYIIDKLFVLRLLNQVSDNVLNVMFYNTKQFITKIIQEQAPHQRLNVEIFKQSLRSYVKAQIDMIMRTISEADCEC